MGDDNKLGEDSDSENSRGSRSRSTSSDKSRESRKSPSIYLERNTKCLTKMGNRFWLRVIQSTRRKRLEAKKRPHWRRIEAPQSPCQKKLKAMTKDRWLMPITLS